MFSIKQEEMISRVCAICRDGGQISGKILKRAQSWREFRDRVYVFGAFLVLPDMESTFKRCYWDKYKGER